MAKKRKAAKSKKRVVKKVKLTPDTAVVIEVPKGIVPSVIADPTSGAVHVVPVPANKIKQPGWFDWLKGTSR